jgi:transcriptional regulator with XRE-family HTH domain
MVETIIAANRVRVIREAQGMTQAQLALRLGWTQRAVSAIESPSRSLRSPTLRRVAAALGVTAIGNVNAPGLR